ncbi:hypothetical protein [Saccharothrix australiensis]|uniref:hypothetical protein n=1 Tax=Saccharothrix australiensis TaxID=2072 RepID=UPI000EB3063E|nr:hypothetical protein [Saccharothrix australiensis]
MSSADSAAALAGHVLGALVEGRAAQVADFLDSCADVVAGLGAVRVASTDVFAPHLLAGHPFEARDAVVVADAFGAFPPVSEPVTHEQRVMAWRDWATTRLLDRLTGDRSSAPDPSSAWPASPCATGVPGPWPEPAADRPGASCATGTPGDPADVLGPVEEWPRWSAVVAQLYPLALPGVDGPVVAAVSREPLALARGTTRAVLRRDHATAARLARWVALLGDRVPLDVHALLTHLRLHAGTGARLLLDLAVARRLAAHP